MTTATGPLGAPFWRFWTSTTFANLADGIRAGAFPLIAASLTDSPFGVALIAACQQGAWLVFGLAAGLLADRRSPGRVLAVADTVRVAALAALFTLLALDAATIPILAGAAFVMGAAETFRDTSAQSMLPRLVPERQLERANGRLFGTEIVGNEFIGPLLGAALFGIALTVPVAVDAAVLVTAVLLVLTLPRTPARSAAPAGTARLRTELLLGVRWLLRNPRQRVISAAGAVICFADAAWWSVLVLYSDSALGVPLALFGALLAAGAVGGTLGALGSERLAAHFGVRPLLAAAALSTGLPAVLIALTDNPIAAGALLALSSAGFALWNVVALSARQRETPPQLLGRVTAVHRIALYGSGMAGALAGGWIAGSVALTVPFHAAGPLVALAAIGLLTTLPPRPDGGPGYGRSGSE
ncbi:MFS transporter [Streptomyces albipurpureus]|uniref:MFS transporter n=1 Tax=Streptomyces albipurpureus TaxID=2897419 RepID=A0ABT0UJ59_9ACTN|nr:MFS transporter [Streptomyces sp. CWNU-1]MCM2388130.1 MFS transporter [Streptomyces sp. CWNU-1]